mgnify:FL=1
MEVLLSLDEVRQRRVYDVTPWWVIVQSIGDNIARLVEEDFPFVGELQASSVGCQVYLTTRV